MRYLPLPPAFYRPSARTVAARLLGHRLVRRLGDGFCGGAIVETEAYLEGDPASHAFRGKTARNAVMFGPPGCAYVYFIYGNHYCVNVVCRETGRAEAVLIRAIEAEIDQAGMRARRPVPDPVQLTNGPGKLCSALAIDGGLDGAGLCDATSGIFIAENPEWREFRRRHGPVVATPRIGISKAAALPLRFCLQGSRFLSRSGTK